MFYILDGRLEVLSGTNVVKAEAGDVIVVPPRLPHAFAADRSSTANVLIIIAPGVERFEYFRTLTRIARGEEPPENLQDVQDLYDNYFLKSPEWKAARKLSLKKHRSLTTSRIAKCGCEPMGPHPTRREDAGDQERA